MEKKTARLCLSLQTNLELELTKLPLWIRKMTMKELCSSGVFITSTVKKDNRTITSLAETPFSTPKVSSRVHAKNLAGTWLFRSQCSSQSDRFSGDWGKWSHSWDRGHFLQRCSTSGEGSAQGSPGSSVCGDECSSVSRNTKGDLISLLWQYTGLAADLS